MKYMVEYLGDIKGRWFFETLDLALAKISKDFPCKNEEYDDWAGTTIVSDTPDPEDDRILVWEILPTGHSKVVWHFSGWHWDSQEFGIPQGSLPGATESLYSIALKGC
jgi:hypothetical protein